MSETNTSNTNDLLFEDELETSTKPWGIEEDQFTMLMHIAQFAGVVVPMAGLALPIVMWATNKENNELVDEHGKNIINWMISLIIYFAIAIPLCFLIIGIPIVMVLGLLTVLFPIIGAVKASNGEVYTYPLTIKFLK